MTAAAGDSGYGVGYPAASGYVTSVGGTELVRDTAAARGWSETAWNSGSGATGSGCSAYEPKPSWQADPGCSRRTDNDVAADADPDTGAAIYDSYDGGRVAGGRRHLRRPLRSSPRPTPWPARRRRRLPGPVPVPAHRRPPRRDLGQRWLVRRVLPVHGPGRVRRPDRLGHARRHGGVPGRRPLGHRGQPGQPAQPGGGEGAPRWPIAARDSGSALPLWYTASGLPAGLSISPGGVISGTPRARGYYAVRVYATDATGMTGSASFRWTVESVGTITALRKCLDDWHGGTANGNKIDIYGCNGGRAQAWLAYPQARRRPSGPAGQGGRPVPDRPGTAQGAVKLWRCGAAGQRWRAGAHGHLVSSRSGLCLADPRAGPSGTWLEVSRCADTGAEHWTLR